MARLLHFALDPFSRRIRLSLSEYGVSAELAEELPWQARPGFLELNPAGTLPVFIDDDGTVAAGIEAVSEYLEETRSAGGITLFGATAAERAETRRLVAWFDGKFHHEVSAPLLKEKVVRRFLGKDQGGGSPNMTRVRAALDALRQHLDYIARLTEARGLLSGPDLTAADLAAAAHLSVLDYLGDISWEAWPEAKIWYQRVKSRPAFRSLLADQVRGIAPSQSYGELDF